MNLRLLLAASTLALAAGCTMGTGPGLDLPPGDGTGDNGGASGSSSGASSNGATGSNGTGGGTAGTSGSGGGGTSGDAGASTSGGGTGGTGGATDGGGGAADAGAPSAGVFTGAPAFSAQTGPSSHNSGRACFGCHNNGSGPNMIFGGTLYADAAGTRTLASAEVRLVDGAGNTHVVYTGTNGNFYLLGSQLTGSWHAGTRDATVLANMVGTITTGNCNGCHTGGSGGTQTARIHLP